MGTEENWNLPLSISPVFIIWVDSLFTLAFSLLVPDQAVHRIYLNWNYVCIYAKQGVLYKFELWLLFTNQILLTHTHTHTHTHLSSLKKQTEDLAIPDLHSHITVIHMWKRVSSIPSTLLHYNTALSTGVLSLFYICFLTSVWIWVYDICFTNNSLPG